MGATAAPGTGRTGRIGRTGRTPGVSGSDQSYGRPMATRYDKDWNKGPDSDGDGLSDRFEEVVLRTDPLDRDTDDDGLNDKREKDFGSDPTDADSDDDGVRDGREVTIGTSPFLDDTDGDGTKDEAEIIAGTAHGPDEDGDGRADWVQSVRDADMDDDGLSDGEEMWLRTNFLSTNSDGDNIDDLDETLLGGDIGRSPSVFDGAPEIRVPDRPHHADDTPVLDTSPEGTIPHASADPPAIDPDPLANPAEVQLADQAISTDFAAPDETFETFETEVAVGDSGSDLLA